MSDDEKKQDPVDDLKKGLGLLFRAARGAVEQLPTEKVEEIVKTGAREVGRAIENVTETIEKDILGGGRKKASEPPKPPEASAPPADAKPTDEPPKGDA